MHPRRCTAPRFRIVVLLLPLPSDAYIEYAFIDPKTGEHIPDPLNPRRVWNGINAYNHYFYMPNGKPSPLIHPVKGIARGTVTRHAVPTRDYAAGPNADRLFISSTG